MFISALLPPNSTILNVTVVDQDGQPGLFSVVNQQPPTNSPLFAVNSSSGALALVADLATASVDTVVVTVMFAESNGSTPQNATQNISVSVQGNYPPTVTSGAEILVPLNAPLGSVVYTATAVSRISASDTLSYALVGGDRLSSFTIDSVLNLTLWRGWGTAAHVVRNRVCAQATGAVSTAVAFPSAEPQGSLIIQVVDHTPLPPNLVSNVTVSVVVMVRAGILGRGECAQREL